MAFPFPPLNNIPKTPKHSEGPAGPPMPHNVSPIAGHKRTIMIFLIAISLLLLLISPLSGPSKQSDRIPFSHNTVEEYKVTLSAALRQSNIEKATSVPSKATKNVASHPQISIFHLSYLPATARSILHSAEIVPNSWTP